MERPWQKRAAELEAKEGPYSDCAAFLEWFEAQENKLVNPSGILEAVDRDGAIGSINLYCIIGELFDVMPDMPEVVEMPKAVQV